MPAVRAIVAEEPGIQTNPLKDKLRQATGVSRAETLGGVIAQAGRVGAIRIERGGPRRPNHHFIAEVVEVVPPVPGDST